MGSTTLPCFDRRFGNERVVPGTIAVEAERTAPGHFIQRSPFVRLNLASSGEALLGPIVGQFTDLGFTCQFIPNEQTLLWSKLCFLGPLALVTFASGKNIGDVLSDAAWKRNYVLPWMRRAPSRMPAGRRSIGKS